jgi:hypothetical protein
MNAKSQMSGMTPPLLPTFGYVFEVRQKIGSLQLCDIWNPWQHKKTWTCIQPLVKREFAATSDNKLIVDGLANLAHRPDENPRKFFS